MYQQYKDNVLGLYSHLDHNNIKRKNSDRRRYKLIKVNEHIISFIWLSLGLLII